MLCQCAFEAVSTATDRRKRYIIMYIELVYGVLCNGSTAFDKWSRSQQEEEDILKQLNGSWSKTYNSWRVCIQKAVKSLLKSRRNDAEDPVLGCFR